MIKGKKVYSILISFVGLCTGVQVLLEGPLDLELQAVVSYWCGYSEPN